MAYQGGYKDLRLQLIWQTERSVEPAAKYPVCHCSPKGPYTRYLGTLDFGPCTCSTDVGVVYDYWVLGPLLGGSGDLGSRSIVPTSPLETPVIMIMKLLTKSP